MNYDGYKEQEVSGLFTEDVQRKYKIPEMYLGKLKKRVQEYLIAYQIRCTSLQYHCNDKQNRAPLRYSCACVRKIYACWLYERCLTQFFPKLCVSHQLPQSVKSVTTIISQIETKFCYDKTLCMYYPTLNVIDIIKTNRK